MAKKILLAGGCSYTDKNYQSHDTSIKVDWPFWPELLANHLNLKCVNYGKSGQCADYIFDSIIEGIEIYKNRVDTVAILWTGADRTPFFNFSLNPIVEVQLPFDDQFNKDNDPFFWMDDVGIGRVSKKYFNNENFNRDKVYRGLILSPLKKMSTIIKLCEHHNIKLIMGQGLGYFDHWSIKRAIKRKKIPEICDIDQIDILRIMASSVFFAHLNSNKKHIIGWPFFEDLNGYVFDHLRFHSDVPKNTYIISEIDAHPNALAQELFAEEFINRYDLLYSV